jgi:hypothetical protein
LSTAEILAMSRDAALALIGLLIVVAILAVLFLYVKVSAILSSAKRTMKDAEDVISTVSSKLVRPATAGSGAAFGVGKALAFLLGFRGKRKEGGSNDD